MLFILTGFCGLGWWQNADREISSAQAIPGASMRAVIWDATFSPKPIEGMVEAHPGMAAPGTGSMHADGFQSDTHPYAGPMGIGLQVRSRQSGNGLPRECSTFVFRSDGKLIAMCGGLTGFRMVLLDPENLTMLATFDLPMRPSSFQAIVKRDVSIIMGDSSGGAYLFLDNRDRLVYADSNQVIRRLEAKKVEGKWHFIVEREWDMKRFVPHDCLNWNNWFPSGECDMITTVLPDHTGRYWWTTRFGRVGTLDPESGKVSQIRLRREEIQNAFAVDSRAVYVLSDHAQYAINADRKGVPQILWRHPYDRGSSRKVGSINQGSGTTPTLIGDRWLTFADNADGRINLVVIRRGLLLPGERRQVCKIPVFKSGASATDNSMIAWGRSILLENNAGFKSAFEQENWNAVAGGVVRIDVRKDESGCDVVWTSPLKVPSVVAKLSGETGIAYYYSFDPAPDETQDWSIVGLDFQSGKQVIKIPTGKGRGYDNNWASLAIAPDGKLYVGTTRGLVQVRPVTPMPRR